MSEWQGPGTVTLGDAVRELAYEVLQVVVAPGGLDVPIGEAVIHDRTAAARMATGDVVLAVGVDPTGAELVELIERAGRARAAVVVAKFPADPPSERLVRAAVEADVALAWTGPDTEWGHLHALVRMIVSTSAKRGRDDDPALGDLFALANAIAQRVGGPVTIEDAQSRLLAYSADPIHIDDYRRDTILGRRVPEDWVRRLDEDGVFRRIWNGRGVVRVSYADSEPGYRDRLVVAVRAGDERLGSIWVQEGPDPLGPDSELLMEEAAGIAALHLVRHFATTTQRNAESELVTAALHGRIPATSLASVMGVGSESPLRVLSIRPVGDESAAGASMARMVSAFNLYRRTSTVPMAAAAAAPLLHVVIGATSRADAVIDDIVQRVRAASPMPLVVASASAPTGPAGIAVARAEADEVAEAGERTTGSPLTLDEMQGRVALLRLRRAAAAMPQLLHGRLDALAEMDERKDSQYLPTIRAFLDCFGDVIAAAASLGVHPNTFRYRLRRALELAGLDVEDPVERVVAHLQLLLIGP
jgi:hypothetical protein